MSEASLAVLGAGVRGLRWWMIGLVFLATLINFVDRLTISVLAPVITVQLGLTNLQFAGIGVILFTLTTRFVVDRFHTYTPIQAAAALLPVLGTLVLFLAGGPIRRLSFEA